MQEDLYPRWLVGSENPVTLWLKLWVLVVGEGGCCGECTEVVLMCSREDTGYAICSRAPGIAVSLQWMATNPQQELPVVSFCGSPSSTPAALGLQRGSLRNVVEAVGVPFPRHLSSIQKTTQAGCGGHICNLSTWEAGAGTP